VDEENFLRVIQIEVQAGQAAGDESPKAVLGTLVPAFMERILSEAASSPLALVEAVTGGMARRDIVVYATDPSAQRAIETLGIAGSLYPTERLVGGYVAVAPSTIGGDKTDAVTKQAIRVREQLLPRGLIETEVEVERTHEGKDSDPWWYQEEHRSYVKVYAPLGATPTSAAGLWIRERDPATYGSTFTTYEPLATSIASLRTYGEVPGVEAFEETGKTVFGFWQRTARGTGTIASVAYARQLSIPLAAGSTYTFVLERQPASTSKYEVEIFAPPGLVFLQTGTTQFTWSSDDPPGRTVIELTLADAS
jgi:hypothetical protein